MFRASTYWMAARGTATSVLRARHRHKPRLRLLPAFVIMRPVDFPGEQTGREAAAHRRDVQDPDGLLVQIQPGRPVRDHFAGEGDLLQAHQIGEHRSEEKDRQGRPSLVRGGQRRDRLAPEIPAQVGPQQIDDDVGGPPEDPFLHGEHRDDARDDAQADQQVHPVLQPGLRQRAFFRHVRAKLRFFPLTRRGAPRRPQWACRPGRRRFPPPGIRGRGPD